MFFYPQKTYAYHSASASDLSSLPAHVYSVAERALRHMLSGMCLSNQSIIISGESGAGKVSCYFRFERNTSIALEQCHSVKALNTCLLQNSAKATNRRLCSMFRHFLYRRDFWSVVLRLLLGIWRCQDILRFF